MCAPHSRVSRPLRHPPGTSSTTASRCGSRSSSPRLHPSTPAPPPSPAPALPPSAIPSCSLLSSSHSTSSGGHRQGTFLSRSQGVIIKVAQHGPEGSHCSDSLLPEDRRIRLWAGWLATARYQQARHL